MKYCEYCGAENKDDREKCHQCGGIFTKRTMYFVPSASTNIRTSMTMPVEESSKEKLSKSTTPIEDTAIVDSLEDFDSLYDPLCDEDMGRLVLAIGSLLLLFCIYFWVL